MTGKDYLNQLTKDGTKVIFTAADVIEAFESGKRSVYELVFDRTIELTLKDGTFEKIFPEIAGEMNGTTNKNQA